MTMPTSSRKPSVVSAKIKPRQPPRRIAERRPKQSGNDDACRQRDQRRQPEMGRAQRRAIGADPHEGRIAKRDLAAIAAEQIEADGDDDVDHREFDEIEIVARRDQRQRRKKRKTNKDQQNTRAHRYTRLTLEAPARPCGRSNNNRMSTPNGTRFLKVAPKNAPA